MSAFDAYAALCEATTAMCKTESVATLTAAAERGESFPVSGDMLAVITRARPYQVRKRRRRVILSAAGRASE